MESINNIFTGDLFFDWAESHLCNQNEPGLFTRCFNGFSDVTGYLPHLLVDSVSHWTGDFAGAIEMIRHPDGKGFFKNRISEIGGVASLLLNGLAKGAALSLRVVLVAFLTLSVPVAVGGAVFLLSSALPVALGAGAVAAALLVAVWGIAKYTEEMEPITEVVTFKEEMDDWKKRYVGKPKLEQYEVNGKKLWLAHDFVTGIWGMNNRINNKPCRDTKEAAEEILQNLDGNETGVSRISEVFNLAAGDALEQKMKEAYPSSHSHTPYMKNASLPDTSYHLAMAPGRPVVLETVMRGTFNQVVDNDSNITDLETPQRYEAISFHDFAAKTVTTTISFQAVQ